MSLTHKQFIRKMMLAVPLLAASSEGQSFDNIKSRLPRSFPPPNSPGMTSEDFEKLAVKPDRCVDPKTGDDCTKELDYALEKQLISPRAAIWAKEKGWYPVINRNNQISAVCKCGCFDASVKILVNIGSEFSERNASEIREKDFVVSLEGSTQLSELSAKSVPVDIVVKGKESRNLIAFKMENSRTLTVTENHRIVVENGTVKAAKDIIQSDKFIEYPSGKTVSIKEISQVTASGEVYNFELKSIEKTGHIVVAEGLLVGDLAWQNQYSAESSSILLRK